jgi:hypothetical protein
MSSIVPPPPHANSFVIGTAVINTHKLCTPPRCCRSRSRCTRSCALRRFSCALWCSQTETILRGTLCTRKHSTPHIPSPPSRRRSGCCARHFCSCYKTICIRVPRVLLHEPWTYVPDTARILSRPAYITKGACSKLDTSMCAILSVAPFALAHIL